MLLVLMSFCFPHFAIFELLCQNMCCIFYLIALYCFITGVFHTKRSLLVQINPHYFLAGLQIKAKT